ncbi:MAG: DEAD/DEAH box helicase [Gammaproteobacteria bacterium]
MRGARFHPIVEAWLRRTFGGPTPVQSRVWEAFADPRHLLVAAPTGAGKTLAAFLGVIDGLVRQGLDDELPSGVQVVYVSPLKALGNDIRKNLEFPLREIRAGLAAAGLPDVDIRIGVRTGDTSPAARALMRRLPPQILVTTPESLYLMLTSDGGRDILRHAHTVIVDEIHALAGNKRGAHLALSLARLARLAARPLRRIGLSATQQPLPEVARFLVGTACAAALDAHCTIVDEGFVRAWDIGIELPSAPLEAVLSTESANELHDRIAALIQAHRTTLVFVNTRRLAERVARALSERVGADVVTSHHGSMAKEARLDAEQRLKEGRLKALVATASLELGIDIGDVDLVCQIGTTRALATLLQRVGRSGHRLGAVPKGRLFPQTRDELVESAALLDMLARGELDQLRVAGPSLDVLAQQVVAAIACEEFRLAELFELCRSAYCYRSLTHQDFMSVLTMLDEGYAFARGKRSAYVHLDRVNGRVRPRVGARLVAIACGGAIPDTADYDVLVEPSGQFIGTVNEDFAIESLPGSIFQLGNNSWRVLRVESSCVRVADAEGQPPNMPFWLGEAPARSAEVSRAVAGLRGEFAACFEASPPAVRREQSCEWLRARGLDAASTGQIYDYLAGGYLALGAMPTQQTLVLERFFDEAEGMQLVIHSPFGSRLNRAWGLALRKRFCRQFNFELQAAAVEDAIVISLGAVHSFPLDDVWRYLKSGNVREVLTQALLDAPMFAVRWRWVASCALAIQRSRHGRRTPPRLMRMYAEDLVSVVFPDQLACAENLRGSRDIPDHPLVRQAIEDCLEDAMDCRGLEALLGSIERGERRLVTRDLTAPSPFAQAVLNANPYAFLDDAPLEERRTQAVAARRWLDADTARDLGALDSDAVARVRAEAWPNPRNRDELHDALSVLVAVDPGVLATFSGVPGGIDAELAGWFAELVAERRAAALRLPDGASVWVSGDSLGAAALWPNAEVVTGRGSYPPAQGARDVWLRDVVRGWLDVCGAVTAPSLAAQMHLPVADVQQELLRLEASGVVLRGTFDTSEHSGEIEWCERRLLARIHRYTLNRLRAEIEPVSAQDFMRFLVGWQFVAPEARVEGVQATQRVLEMLAGFEAPAGAWENALLPLRVRDYDGTHLDRLTQNGRFSWLRAGGREVRRVANFNRTTPVMFVPRAEALRSLENATEATGNGVLLGHAARCLHDHLGRQGATFFDEIVTGTGLLRSQCEAALGELVASGLATSDSVVGLRALSTPQNRRKPLNGGRRRGVSAAGVEDAGRWSLVPCAESRTQGDEAVIAAHRLLRRYGVVFRKLVERERLPVPWLDVLRELRRQESRGEVRGGRFVAGFSGEQFALPEALSELRQARGNRTGDSMVIVNATDPLNLSGIVTPGVRIPATLQSDLVLFGGEPIAVKVGNEVRLLKHVPADLEVRVRTAFIGHRPGAGARRVRR